VRATANLLLVFLASAALAQETLEVIPLRHRSAEHVIPVLRPLLEPGGALTGQNYQLIVRTSPANLAQIRAALEAIDKPARRLVISVRFDRTEESAASAIRGEGRISNRGSSAEVRIRGSQGSSGEQVDQRIQVLEGGQAILSSGESRVYADAATGFRVVPRLAGGGVILEILAQQENFARGGAIQGQHAASTVSGRLGEWFEIGGAAVAASRQDSGILSQRETSRSSDRRIWVKVEEVPN
jgi:type II secretory pathway component GspD/PulD (secretin)